MRIPFSQSKLGRRTNGIQMVKGIFSQGLVQQPQDGGFPAGCFREFSRNAQAEG